MGKEGRKVRRKKERNIAVENTSKAVMLKEKNEMKER
jgi:hypothetical protein